MATVPSRKEKLMIKNLGMLEVLFVPRIMRHQWKIVLKIVKLYKFIFKKDVSIKFKHSLCNRELELSYQIKKLEELASESYTDEELEILDKYVINPMTDVCQLMIQCSL